MLVVRRMRLMFHQDLSVAHWCTMERVLWELLKTWQHWQQIKRSAFCCQKTQAHLCRRGRIFKTLLRELLAQLRRSICTQFRSVSKKSCAIVCWWTLRRLDRIAKSLSIQSWTWSGLGQQRLIIARIVDATRLPRSSILKACKARWQPRLTLKIIQYRLVPSLEVVRLIA